MTPEEEERTRIFNTACDNAGLNSVRIRPIQITDAYYDPHTGERMNPLTPEEINEAVARKLGWKLEDNLWRDPRHGGQRSEWGPEFTIPYSTDIKAAWEIVEYMGEKGIGLQLNQDISSGYKTEWWATFHNETLGYLGGEPWIRSDLSAPMAICLAFLKLEDK